MKTIKTQIKKQKRIKKFNITSLRINSKKKKIIFVNVEFKGEIVNKVTQDIQNYVTQK